MILPTLIDAICSWGAGHSDLFINLYYYGAF
jgi:hypothetical protein